MTLAEPVQVESTEIDKTQASVWGYRTEMGKQLGEEAKNITLGEQENLSAWAEVNFAGSGQEKAFDRNLQLLMRYADAGPDKMPWANDKRDPWGSRSWVQLKNGLKDIVNETRKDDTLNKISIRTHNYFPSHPTYVIQGEGSENGERKIYICGGSKDKKIDEVMEEIAEIVTLAKNGLKYNPSIPFAEKQALDLI